MHAGGLLSLAGLLSRNSTIELVDISFNMLSLNGADALRVRMDMSALLKPSTINVLSRETGRIAVKSNVENTYYVLLFSKSRERTGPCSIV